VLAGILICPAQEPPPQGYDQVNAILYNVRQGANGRGRTWAVMCDLSGMQPGEIDSVIIEDWKRLVDRMQSPPISRTGAWHWRGQLHREAHLQPCRARVRDCVPHVSKKVEA
jgi:hypothetical protein